jgi:DNA-binding LacI/PurR family transcriptional regulator
VRDDAPPPVTLEHVALAAGVSRATVSRALTGSGPVAAETLRRVRSAADALGYVGDPVARALVNGAGTRVVVAMTGTSEDILGCAYLAHVLMAGALTCTSEGLGIAVRPLPLDDPAPELERLARDRTVAGVVLVNTTYRMLEAVPRSLTGRVVSIGIGSSVVPSFDVDGVAVADTSTAHLLRSGRRRIAMITGPRWLPCSRRPVAGHRAVMASAGLPAHIVAGGFDQQAGEEGAREILRRWPDTNAIISSCDDVALGALRVLRQHGRQVPGDVAVAGFDDIPTAEHTGLTTATHPVERIATAAVRATMNRADAGATVFFPSRLVVRATA